MEAYSRKEKPMKIEFNIDPMGKPRMTRSDRWKKRKCVLKYFAFKDNLRRLASKAFYYPKDEIDITFYIKMPDSWSKKKKERMNGSPHDSKPDIDNMLKCVMDSLIERDQSVYKIKAEKYWSYEGKIIVEQ